MKKVKNMFLAKLRRGFTLVELVIVIAVIAVLAAVLIPTFINVIDSANNSADVQLAANLNSYLAGEMQIDSDVVASAQNIRHVAQGAGYDAEDLVTKKQDNVIAFDKEEQRFVALDISKIPAEDLVPGYYAEEVISGYIIVSTGGNDLAEALYQLANLPAENTAAASISSINKVMTPLADTPSITDQIASHVQSALDGIKNNDIRGVVTSIVNSTLYVNKDGNMFFISVDNDKVEAQLITKADIPSYATAPGNIVDKTEGRVRTRVVFSEDVTTFNVENLAVEKSALNVIVPQNVELTGTIDASATEIPKFSGNVGSVVPSKFVRSVENTKERIETNDMETIILYNANQVYTSDFSGSFSEALKMAAKLHNIKEKYPDSAKEGVDYSTIRLVVNSKVEIDSEITIPSYVDVQIPFAKDNSFAKEIMTYTKGNLLGNKELGSAYPANDADNLQKSEKNREYYLCGEGPGNGYDVMLSTYLAKLTKDELPEGFESVDNVVLEKAKELFKAEKNISTEQATYSLSISNGAKLKVQGRLTVGAVIGYDNAGGYQGHTSGKHGQINNNGTIEVNEGGVLDVFGFVKGDGNVVVNKGGMVFEPFVITDYLDTIFTLSLFPFSAFPIGAILPGQEAGTHIPTMDDMFNSPFMRYAVQNIQNTLTLNYGSSLYGRANLIVFGGMLYCRADAPLITSDNYVFDPSKNNGKGAYIPIEKFAEEDGWYDDAACTQGVKGIPQDGACFKRVDTQRYMATNSGALQMTKEGASIICKYDGDRNIQIHEGQCEAYEYQELSNRNSFAGDIGVVTIEMNGDVITSGIKMDLLGGTIQLGNHACEFYKTSIPVDTGMCDLPVPYNFHFIVNGNLTIGNGNSFVFMPGSELTVTKNGTIAIEENAGLYALATYNDSEFLRSFGEMMLNASSGTDYELKRGVDGNYYAALLDQADEEVKDASVEEIILEYVLGSLGSFAPKYYPTGTLLTSNGFSSSAKFTVNGEITVKNGGDLGGTVLAGNEAMIKIESGAGMGKIVNLGGLYDANNDFLNILKGSHQNVLISILCSNMPFPTKGLPIDCLGAVYVPCFLEIVNSDGAAVDFTVNRQESAETSTFALTEGTVFTSELSEGVMIAKSESGVTVTTTAYKAIAEIVIDASELTKAAGEPATDTKVAYFSYDAQSKTLTFKDNTPAE